MENFHIAIDGPGGSGKSTLAKILAKKLSLEYVDTGAMYRAIALKTIQEKINLKSAKEVESFLKNTKINFDKGKIYLDNKDVSEYIRSTEISKKAAEISQLQEVREKLVSLQREIAKDRSIIMDGRDIGTNVLKNAKFKFYITASAKERALRRHRELLEKGVEIDFDEVLKDIENRDYQDINRELNPLKRADDALVIDTTELTLDMVVEKIIGEVKKWQ